MKNAVFHFEVKTWLKAPIFYFLVISFFLFSLITMLGTGGFFDNPSSPTHTVKLLNSPYSIIFISFLLTKLLLFGVAVFAGFSLYRDYKNNTHAIIYSYPISKSYYLNGKVLSVLFILLLISLILFSGIYIGEVLLTDENPKIGVFHLSGYISSFGLYMAPSLIVVGIFVFVTVGISRNIYSGFIIVICFVLFQLIVENTLFENKELLAILDPFGQNAFYSASWNWNIEKQNSPALPVNHLIILNRVLWLFLAFLYYFIFTRKFNFQYDAIWQLSRISPSKIQVRNTPLNPIKSDSSISKDFSFKARWQALLYLMIYDFKSILRNWLFLILSALGLLTVFFIQLKVSNTGDFNLHPFTRLIIGAPLSLYTIILILSTFLFSGLLIHRDKQYNIKEILDASPIKNWQMIFSKISAISLVQLFQLCLFFLMGLTIQTINGYFNFELETYFFHLFILVFPVLFVWNLTSHFVHSLIPNLFLGLFFLAGIWLVGQSLDHVSINTYLLKYNTLPGLEYTDFDKYGHSLQAYFSLMGYWLIFGLLLLAGTFLFWNRGSLSYLKERLVLIKSRFNIKLLCLMSLIVFSFIWIGHSIYKAEIADKKYLFSELNGNQNLEEYKKEWLSFSEITQPKITDINLWIDLYPDTQRFIAKGNYYLVNKSKKAIDTLFIRTGFDEITDLKWGERAQLLKVDSNFKSFLYQLNTALQPDDTLQLDFTIRNIPNTLFTRNSNVLADGSYLKHDILPRLGYQFITSELPIRDSLVNRNHYFHRDADYVNLTTTIQTDKGQIAIAPGELLSTKIDGQRSSYSYATSKPVKINFSFHSSKYEILKEEYKGVGLEVFYKKAHHYNTRLMIEGLKASLDFNTKYFGQYPYKQLRVVEFPYSENSYSATLTANNIPSSEILFNINSAAMRDKLNLPFYVMAHELTHEWFGNQLMPADAEGAKMLTESITEYITLSIYRKHFGDHMADNFLAAQQKRYTRGKNFEKQEERPLHKVLSHQEYIAYAKGAIAFDKIAKTLGKERFHSVLQGFFLKYKSQTLYYPTTEDFMLFLKEQTSTEEYKFANYWITEINDF